MRVMVVHNFYRLPGGEDSVVQDEVALLKKNGVEVKLFAADSNDIKGISGTVAAAFGVVYSLRARRQLSRELAEFLPDVVHIHNFFPLLSPSILDACLDAGVPAIITLHNFRIFSPSALFNPEEMPPNRTLQDSCWWAIPKKIYRNSATATLVMAAMIEFHKRTGTWKRKVDRFIALSDWAKRVLTETGLPSERVVVKPNGVARPPVFDVQRNGGLFVGRLTEQKGIRILLQAWRGIDFPLRIIGDGPLSKLVERSVSNRITYLGRLPREAVQREMQAAKLLALPSIGCDMCPMTVLEAFANRLPVICSDLPSLKDFITPGVTGLTFAAGDANALASQVQWAVSNPAALEALSCRSQSAYEDRYAPETNFKQLIAIYRSVSRDQCLGETLRPEPGISADQPHRGRYQATRFRSPTVTKRRLPSMWRLSALSGRRIY